MITFKKGSLALYKREPALINKFGDKIEIERPNGEILRVRPKDLHLIHPGPISKLSALKDIPNDELVEAWEILEGQETTLSELCELAFQEYSPSTAWQTWLFVAKGPYFTGDPEKITAATREVVEQHEARAAAKEEADKRYQDFLSHLRSSQLTQEEKQMFGDVESLALGKSAGSRTLKDLHKKQTSEQAHRLLLEYGIWGVEKNPHPDRLGLGLRNILIKVPSLAEEERLDLTALTAYAIDDEGTTTPDDAISFDGKHLWIHIADPAALIVPGSKLDESARERGSTLHLPDLIVHMLPEKAIEILGLGLGETSPALSLCLEIDSEGQARPLQLTPSLVRVERMTYEEAEDNLAAGPIAGAASILSKRRAFRFTHGAVDIQLPEVRVRVSSEGKIEVTPISHTESRDIVQESMIAAGEALAWWCIERNLPIPFSSQRGGDSLGTPNTLSDMHAARRKMARSARSLKPSPHAGLGVAVYTQGTSPLRRYLDLLVHQQIRASLSGRPILSEDEVLRAIGETDAVSGAVRKAEQFSERHWILAYLLQNSDWQGEAVVVARQRGGYTVLIPELGLESFFAPAREHSLDERVLVGIKGIDLPKLELVIGEI